MGYALIAGVDPIYGLYTGIVTALVGALTASSRFMIITLTNAIALVVADSLGTLGGPEQLPALFTLTLLVGGIQLLLGILNLGGLIRYVNDEVMTGFIIATAALLVLGQLETLVGYANTIDGVVLVRTITLLQNVDGWNVATSTVGLGTIIVILLLKRSSWGRYAEVVAIVLAASVVAAFDSTSIRVVGDVAAVPNRLPTPVVPDAQLAPSIVTGALAVAIIALIESAGISAAFSDPERERTDQSRNFSAHGIANIVGGLFQALPGGGSFSRTGINVSSGAETRWAGVYSGVVLAIIVLFAGPLVELIPMASLAGLLIVIGLEIIVNEWGDAVRSWTVSKTASIAMFATFVIGVWISLELAVFAGVALSLLLYVYTSATDVELERLIPRGPCHFEAGPFPDTLPSNQVTIFYPRSSLYFASVYTLADHLPAADSAEHAIVVLRLRGRDELSNTFVNWLEQYIENLRSAGNDIVLSGVSAELIDELGRVGLIQVLGPGHVFEKESVLGASTQNALMTATARLAEEEAR